MKLIKSKQFWIITTVMLSLGYVVSCTKRDQIIIPGAGATVSTTTLVSVKTTTAPTIDGTVESLWKNAPALDITPTVPDPGNGLFTGYNGQTYPATLQSMYDDQYIYFLAQWSDPTQSVYVATWYFDPVAQLWAQEPTSKTFDSNGNVTRDGFGEDKFAMLFNIDNSTPKFISQTCYASCHVFQPYTNFAVSPPVEVSNANNGNHYTNGASEKIDMWWCHLSRDVIFNQMDDDYQDWAGGPAITNLTGGSANGRHVDDLVVNGTSTTWPYGPTYTTALPQGALNNKQTLKLNGTGSKVSVPMWIYPDASNYYYVLASDTLAGGKAVKITGVSSTGVLTYAGGKIDPNSGTDYQRTGDPVFGGDGPKCFPSYIASPLIGGRADITASAIYTGSGWIVEYKRKLKTGDVLKQDVDFSSLQDQPFGFAIWNKSNNQHGIQPYLLLTFKK
ncbi:ethylbenzene dehydrogenase-related protein [Mucilaginibacter sp.]|uniref:ethylbenzene dehydrogenase-related protein n=1 Tax=Mucilaginibacter sp. TaxID=1882438 RepID=UPI002850C0BD|nr:ethylbenzene dehydrogenase-related protein [Mucilaginibacter sp.]MDR3694080.1 ethylbenzene dehydrogenase-related protein [Mucilaginibacter sp.]